MENFVPDLVHLQALAVVLWLDHERPPADAVRHVVPERRPLAIAATVIAIVVAVVTGAGLWVESFHRRYGLPEPEVLLPLLQRPFRDRVHWPCGTTATATPLPPALAFPASPARRSRALPPLLLLLQPLFLGLLLSPHPLAGEEVVADPPEVTARRPRLVGVKLLEEVLFLEVDLEVLEQDAHLL